MGGSLALVTGQAASANSGRPAAAGNNDSGRSAMAELIETLDELAEGYAAIFCDVWGVVHNGIRPFQNAVDALRRARQKGNATVVLDIH